MCKCVLPPGANPIAVDKYINININIKWPESVQCRQEVGAFIKRTQKCRFPKNRKFLARLNNYQISSKKFDRRIRWLGNALENSWKLK
jgi:hypothetical protein